jgi:hypothetical protein
VVGQPIVFDISPMKSDEQPIANLDLGPVAIERLGLIEYELGGVIKVVKISAATGIALGRVVAVSAE